MSRGAPPRGHSISRFLWLRLPQAWTRRLKAGWRQLQPCLPTAVSRYLVAGTVDAVLLAEGAGWQLWAGEPEVLLGSWDDRLEPAMQQQQIADAMQGVDSEDRRLWLGIPVQRGLIRDMKLPATARRSLPQIAHYEMDRQTPFRPDQVYADIREVDASATDAGLRIQLAVVPRSQIDPWLHRLAELGIALDGMDLLVAGKRCGFNLLPLEQRTRRVHWRQRINAWLGCITVLLLLCCVWQWQANRHAVLRRMHAEIAVQQAQLAQMDRLQQRWSQSGKAEDFLLQRRQQSISVLKVMQELSQRLPDDVYLQRLSIDADGRLGLMGLAPQAAHLVDLLKGAQYIAEPVFQGTILRDPLSGKERFAMAARVRPPQPKGAR